jgi:ribosomal protein L12E/L44/L45/RPP1/RPP2
VGGWLGPLGGLLVIALLWSSIAKGDDEAIPRPVHDPRKCVMPKEEPEYPAPPCRFKCNRSRMILTIQVQLPHVGPNQISLCTSKKKIELDTLQSRRKFKMSREYPRGIECEDAKTTARMEGGTLIIEMPITKLPAPGAAAAAAAAAASSSQQSGAASKKKKKRSLEEEEEEEEEEDEPQPKKKKKKRAVEAAVDDDDDDVPVKRSKTTSRDKGAPSDERMHELMEEASAADAKRREKGLDKMRQLQAAEAAQKEKEKAKQAERSAQKQKLLASFKRQQATAKADRKEQASIAAAAVEQAERRAAAKGSKSAKAAGNGSDGRRRVSFGPDV